MNCEHDSQRYDAIAEGVCPTCDVRMDRCPDCTGREAHGTCPCCGGGWSRDGDTVSVHITMNNPFLLHGSRPVSEGGEGWSAA